MLKTSDASRSVRSTGAACALVSASRRIRHESRRKPYSCDITCSGLTAAGAQQLSYFQHKINNAINKRAQSLGIVQVDWRCKRVKGICQPNTAD